MFSFHHVAPVIVTVLLFSFASSFTIIPSARIIPSNLYMNKPSLSEGYGPIGSLIRQGPVPFFIRLAKPDTYEAAVNKYMALERCSRAEAQGNMDAYFQDPNGWAGNKLRERKPGGVKLDYVNANTDKNSLILTAVWSVGILSLFYRIFAVQVLGQ